MNSRSSHNKAEADNTTSPAVPKTTKRQKSLLARDVSKYLLCGSAKEKVALYCKENGKPEPQYRHWMNGKMYKAKVYVARTYGWVTGEKAKSTVSEAEECVAEMLVQKLQLT